MMTGGAMRLAAGVALVLFAGSCSPKAPGEGFSRHVSLLTGAVTLPIERWVLNHGIIVESARFCQKPACDGPSAHIVLVATGEAERSLKAELASDKALKARRPPARTRLIGGGVRIERGKLTAETTIRRSLHDGHEVTSLTFRPRSGHGPVAHAVVLAESLLAGTRFTLSVADRPEMALSGVGITGLRP